VGRVSYGLLAALALAGGVALSAIPASAQDQKTLDIELNKDEQVDTACRLTFRARNNLGTRLTKASFIMSMLDARGVVASTVVLDFKSLPAGKKKTLQFDLQPRCDTMAKLALEVKECAGEADMLQACEDGLKLTSLSKIQFE
jgi:hypothetical protein